MIGLDRGHFLSPSGQCKSFDASADGYCRGEGCGIFVLKRLSDAIAENDNIMGVIRGIEVNQSGLAHSITHPHVPTQISLFNRLLANVDLGPERVSVVEAHGTGTQAGDSCELKSIRTVFSRNRTASNPLVVTCIKANIGHLEAASGAAGLAKLLLMLRHHTAPRQISLEHLNPKIALLEPDHIVINTMDMPWEMLPGGHPRLALLNNFGAAGSNAAMLLEEFIDRTPPTFLPESTCFVFGMSAKTQNSLNALKNRCLQWLQNGASENVSLSDIAYTLTARRQIYPYRISVAASGKQELFDKLTSASSTQVICESTGVVFLFSGQGSQYLGMGASLYRRSSFFKDHVDECHDFLVGGGFPGVLDIITTETSTNITEKYVSEGYQAAIFTLEYAIAKLWISWGIKPVAVVGHR